MVFIVYGGVAMVKFSFSLEVVRRPNKADFAKRRVDSKAVETKQQFEQSI